MSYRFDAEVWLHEGDAAWHFITLPGEVSDDIGARMAGRTGGFGSVRVRVRIGSSRWSTWVFPDSRREAFVLPVERAVRAAEGIEAGDRVAVALTRADG